MTAMINLRNGAADPALAAEMLRRRWQEKPAYFPPRTVWTLPKLHATWLRPPGEAAPVMQWSDLHSVQT